MTIRHRPMSRHQEWVCGEERSKKRETMWAADLQRVDEETIRVTL
jgi:hypothetical protein